MTIGEALKFIQDNKKLTEEEMTKGIIRKGTYSKVIHNKQNLSSVLLIRLLLANKIDINYFISLVKDVYSSDELLKEEKLSDKIGLALNNHEVEDAKEYLKEIKKLGTNPFLEQRATIAVYFLEDRLDQIDLKFKEEVIQEFNENDSWILNLEMLKLFGMSMMILPPEEIEFEMKLFFVRLKRMHEVSLDMTERYAILCSNYLHWKYTNDKDLNDNVLNAIHFLKNLPKHQHLFLYMVSGKYYYCLFNDQMNKAKEIKNKLLQLGCTMGVKNWPE